MKRLPFCCLTSIVFVNRLFMEIPLRPRNVISHPFTLGNLFLITIKCLILIHMMCNARPCTLRYGKCIVTNVRSRKEKKISWNIETLHLWILWLDNPVKIVSYFSPTIFHPWNKIIFKYIVFALKDIKKNMLPMPIFLKLVLISV